MKDSRHPHPHLDPRQPRDGAKPRTNPPVFAWKPAGEDESFRLTIARDAAFAEVCLHLEDLREPVHLPEEAFEPGRYFWKWSPFAKASGDESEGSAESEVFSFEIAADAVRLEVPPASDWLERVPAGHPRIYVRPEQVAALRESRTGGQAQTWQQLRAIADALLEEPHEYPEPPFLPSWSEDYQRCFKIWSGILWNSRRFVKGAETLALAYLASGEAKYARAACQRMASVSRWDPEGSSHISHNDEAHMSVIWDGTKVCDWVWDHFTDEERELVIEQFRRRGQITFEHVHSLGSYGVTRFDSHSGREIVFLALLGFVFHEQIPEATEWLEWLRPVLCGIWPIWAGDDGAWAEGPSYGLAYVQIMTMFATALKRGAGVDLYRRPFWQNHAHWREWFLPPYAEWIGFGDHSERWESTWQRNADLVELIDRESGAGRFGRYVAALREEAGHFPTPSQRTMPGISAQRYLSVTGGQSSRPGGMTVPDPPERDERVLRVFPAAGCAAIRTHLDDPSRDIALLFRSSPFGAISHSHASNNDFVIHVAGKVLAMPSGYYDGYGSDHHAQWVWHTKSHNCVTLSDAPQLMRSHESVGAIENAFEDERLAYFRGTADASYSDRALRCRRHVVFLKPHNCFVMIDEFVTVPGIASALQWNIHSWNEFAVDEDRRSFLIEREGSSLEGHFMSHHNAFFSLSEGWDPPPARIKDDAQWYQQYHLRFTVSGFAERRTLGVVLCPGHASLSRTQVQTEHGDAAEVVRIGDDLVMVNQGGRMEYEGLSSEALVLLVVDGRRYEIADEGLDLLDGAGT